MRGKYVPFKIAAVKGIPAEERAIDRTELYTADELFFSGSSARVWAIGLVDKRIIGKSKISPITKLLQQAYLDVQTKKVVLDSSWYTSVGVQ